MNRKHSATDHPDVSWDTLRETLIDGGAHPDDVDRFDAHLSRRGFFGLLGRGSAAVALSGLGYGALEGLFGRGLIPVAWAQEAEKKTPIEGKPDMTIHNRRPVNGEFAPHLLDDDITPTERHFVRNNGLVPARAEKRDLQGWSLTIDGEVHKPLKLSLDDLKGMSSVSMPLLIECGGNGRALFEPSVRGNQWGRGAIGCAEWKGVRLRDLLKEAGLKDSAVYTGHYGEDPPLAGDKPPLSRGVPIDKAMDEHTLVAYQMNGEDLAPLNGFPVRIVVPGWIGSCSQKWLTRIWVRDQQHDGPKMLGYSYRVPRYPVEPGKQPPEEVMEVATSWVIKSMITAPAESTRADPGKKIKVRGHAWAGDRAVKKVELSTDYGINWQETSLGEPANRYAWYSFEGEVQLPDKGYYEIWARAYDDQGNAQPFRQPWNPKGYLGNVVHRVPVLVGI